MGFQVSPGVEVKEVDLTNIVPAVSTTIGAVCGPFEKGPVSEITSISSEKQLVEVFGKPNANNFEYFFTAANFLQYSNSLRVVRTESALKNASSGGSGILIRNTLHYQESFADGQGTHGTWSARTAGIHANGIKIDICDKNNFSEMSNKQVNDASASAAEATITMDAFDAADFAVGEVIEFYSDAGGTVFATGHEAQKYEITAVDTSAETITIRQLDDPAGSGLIADLADDSYVKRYWRFSDLFDTAPGTSEFASARGVGDDEIHIVVYDSSGRQTGFDNDVAGERLNSVLETFAFVSKHPEATTPQGNSNYYPDVIYRDSKFIYWGDHPTAAIDASGDWGQPLSSDLSVQGSKFFNKLSTGVENVDRSTLANGTDDYAVTDGEQLTSYARFDDGEAVDVNLIMAAKATSTLATNLVTIVEKRKDALVFISPERSDVVGVADSNTQTTNVKNFFDLLPSTSFAVFDSGYKYQYDRFNDVYRYVPLNGDIAGVTAFTESVADAFFSPAGFTRGQIRGAVKLAYEPNKDQRDTLYKARINPVNSFPGQGTVLFGDKTALAKPSAFDRINVRRLFIILEKAIATAAKFQLFEFNDEFTRAQFKNLVEPFLREIQGRRGITDFKVVADESNNTGEVIDRNEFVADIFVKPTRSINFITLNFVAVRTGVAFTEIGG
jgi:phage tail sheath protein FI